MVTNATPKRTEIVVLYLVLSLAMTAVIDADEPWRPETAAAVGRALALAEPSEEENFTMSLGGARAGVNPAFAAASSHNMALPQGFTLVTSALWPYSQEFSRRAIPETVLDAPMPPLHDYAVRDLFERSTLTPQEQKWMTQVLNDDFSFSKDLTEAQRSAFADKLSIKAMTIDMEANRSLFTDNSSQKLAMAKGLNVGLTVLGVGASALDAFGGTGGFASTVYSASEIANRGLDPSTALGGGIAVADLIGNAAKTGYQKPMWGASTANALLGGFQRSNEIKSVESHLFQLSQRPEMIRAHNAPFDLSNRLRECAQVLYTQNAVINFDKSLHEVYGSITSYFDRVGETAYLGRQAMNPSVDPLVRIEASNRFAENYFKLGGSNPSRDFIIDRTLDLHEMGFRQLPNTNRWVPGDIASTTSYANAQLSKARNPTEWAREMGRLGGQGINVATSPYTYGDYSFSRNPLLGSVPVMKTPECRTYFRQVPSSSPWGGFTIESYTICH